MEKSCIAQGQMFIQFPQPIAELQDTPKPRVWVKIANKVFGNHYGEDKKEISVFVDNDVLVKFAVSNYQPSLTDKWSITDGYYNKMVGEGRFVPVDDLRKTDDICKQMGWPKYEIDLGF